MTELKQDDQLEHTYSRFVRIQDVAQKTRQRRGTIGKSGERGSGISMLVARHDDDDDDDTFTHMYPLHIYIYIYIYIYTNTQTYRVTVVGLVVMPYFTAPVSFMRDKCPSRKCWTSSVLESSLWTEICSYFVHANIYLRHMNIFQRLCFLLLYFRTLYINNISVYLSAFLLLLSVLSVDDKLAQDALNLFNTTCCDAIFSYVNVLYKSIYNLSNGYAYI